MAKKQHYNRLAKFSVQEVYDMYWLTQKCLFDPEGNFPHKKRKDVFGGKLMDIKVRKFAYGACVFTVYSDRYDNFFLNGMECKHCGLKGEYFWLESNIFNKKTGHWSGYHFNLYGTDADGKEVMFTKDHIVPKSKGGANSVSNYQCLCERCNHKKADKMEV